MDTVLDDEGATPASSSRVHPEMGYDNGRGLVEQHLRKLVLLCLLIHVLVAFLALLTSFLPAFDSSADILLDVKGLSLLKRWIATTLRWDAFHFLHITQTSYQFEHEWAFFPGVPIVLRSIEWVIRFVTFSSYDPSTYGIFLGHFFLSTIVTCETVRTLYLLTMQHTGSPAFSLLSAYLSLLSSSPATLHIAPYAEPWVALWSYKGMLCCAQRRWFLASLWFALAGMFRSNNVLLVGFVIWGMVVEPLVSSRRVKPFTTFLCILLSVFPLSPFFLHQLSGYLSFCIHPISTIRPWCTSRLPLIYTHVQSHYWNVGFMRYWTLQQLPNFLISAPVLLLLIFSSITHILRISPHLFSANSKPKPTSAHSLFTFAVLPHAIHALVLTSMLLFLSHTQIILRLASSMPFTYWSAARLFLEHPKWAKAWTAWSVVWGAMSVVLWTAFLPPA